MEGALREIGEELGIHAEAEELRDLGLLEKVSHGVFYGKPFHDHEVSAVYLYTKPVEAEKLHLQESEVEADPLDGSQRVPEGGKRRKHSQLY